MTVEQEHSAVGIIGSMLATRGQISLVAIPWLVLFYGLMWIYLSSCVCVFGICFCAALAEVRAESE